jgi:hypothetical protein
MFFSIHVIYDLSQASRTQSHSSRESNRCAIWNAFVSRIGFLFSGYNGITNLNDIEVANVWGAQLHIFTIDFKVMIDLD